MKPYNSDLLELHNEMKANGILIYFSGPFSQAIIEDLGSSLRKKIKITGETSKVIKVFSVFIEQAQNIINYSVNKYYFPNAAVDTAKIGVGVIVVGKYDDDKYFIQCGNEVLNTDVEHLDKKLSILKGKNKEELKIIYKEQRNAGPDKKSKGAGLGFIEMARRSSEPLDYSITQLNDKYSFFTITTVV